MKSRWYLVHEKWVEVGNGKGRKPLVGEILAVQKSYRYSRALGRYTERDVKSTVIQYDILFTDGSRKWVYQEQILRVQPDPDQQELEARARKLLGEDYL